MRKFLLFTFVVFVSAIAVAWWLLSDANRYKPQIVELIREHTGLTVAIRGDLKWRLWPPVQLVAQDVTADWAADAPEPMLAARSLSLDADVWPLLAKNRKLIVQGVAIAGLRAKLIEHGETANWMPPRHAGPVVAPLPVPPPSSDPATPWEVASIALTDAVIDYVIDDKPTQIVVDALEMKGIAPTRHFPLHAKLMVKKGELEMPLTIAAELTFDEAVTQWQLDNVDISGVYGNPGLPFQIKTNAQLDTRAGTGSLQNAQVDLARVSATFDVAVADLRTTPQYNGHLDLPQQPIDSIAGLFGTHLDAPVGVKTAFNATEKRVDLTGTELRYGPSMITGKIGTPIGGKLNIAFDLATDRFVVPSNRTAVAMLGGGSFAVLAFAAPSVSVDPALDAPVLPLDLIRSTDWNGKIAIAQLEQDGATFHNATITSSNESGVVSGALDLPEFFHGTAMTQLKLDATGSTPQWNIAPKLNHVDSQAMLQWLHEKYDWVATFLAGGEFTASGNTKRELITSLSGHTTFDGGQGVINITEIKNAAMGIAKVAGGTDKISAWPDRLKYQRFTGTWDAKGTDQMLDVALDNLTLKAKGKFDTLADDMDLRATITVNDDPKYNSFKVGSSLTGLPLPIRCRGSLAAPKCGADDEGTRQLVADALSGKDPKAKEKLDKAIDEKVPAQYRDAARSLLEMLNKGSQKGAQQPKSP